MRARIPARRSLLVVGATLGTLLSLFLSGTAQAATYSTTTLMNHDSTTWFSRGANARNPSQSYSMKQYKYSDGRVAHRMELRSGDQTAEDKKQFTDGRQRNELNGQTEFALHTNLWFSFAFKWTGQMPTQDWVMMSAFHQDRDSCDIRNNPSPFAIQQVNGNLVVQTRSDSHSCTTQTPAEHTRYSQPWLSANTWHRFVGRVDFEPGGNGSFTLWIDGVKHSVGNIPIGLNNVLGPHFTVGQYRGKSGADTTFFFANERSGTTDLSSKVTNPDPLPAL
jgi:hypothetical protein